MPNYECLLFGKPSFLDPSNNSQLCNLNLMLFNVLKCVTYRSWRYPLSLKYWFLDHLHREYWRFWHSYSLIYIYNLVTQIYKLFYIVFFKLPSTEYMVKKLGIDEKKVLEISPILYKTYGTTMAGLRVWSYLVKRKK